MKTVFKTFTLLAIFIPTLSFSQDVYGVATYESQVSLKGTEFSKESNPDLPDDLRKLIEEQTKSAFQKTFTLRFNKTASLYEEVEKPKALASNPNVNIQFSMIGAGGPKTIVYKNLKDKVSVMQTELLDKPFLVKDSLPKNEWQLQKETKIIGQYECHKATYIQKIDKSSLNENSILAADLADLPDELTVTAWYTLDIPVNHGPAEYWGLPGLILELNDGQTIVLCSKIILNPAQKPEIKAPVKGKVISKKDFEKKRDEKTAEFMKANNISGNGTFIIKSN